MSNLAKRAVIRAASGLTLVMMFILEEESRVFPGVRGSGGAGILLNYSPANDAFSTELRAPEPVTSD